jgi:hypothetical protein
MKEAGSPRILFENLSLARIEAKWFRIIESWLLLSLRASLARLCGGLSRRWVGSALNPGV